MKINEHGDGDLQKLDPLESVRNEFLSDAKNTYSVMRLGTMITGIINFYRSSNPYFPYITTDESGKFLVQMGSKETSWIDLKSVDYKATLRKIDTFLKEIEQGGAQFHPEYEEIIKSVFQIIITHASSLGKRELQESIERSERYKKITFDAEKNYNQKEKTILRTLYQVAGKNRNQYFSRSEKNTKKNQERNIEMITINGSGREHFTKTFFAILSGLENLNVLSRHRIFLGTHVKYTIDEHITTKPFTEYDIVSIMSFLMSKTSVETLSQLPEYSGHEADHLKSIANSIDHQKSILVDKIYTLYYAYEKYNIHFLREFVEPNIEEFKANIDSSLNVHLGGENFNPENTDSDNWHCFTQRRPKSDSSIAIKILNKRDDNLKDILGGRVYLNSNKYPTKESKKEVIKKLIPKLISQLTLFYKELGYEMIINEIKFLNSIQDLLGIEDDKEILTLLQSKISGDNPDSKITCLCKCKTNQTQSIDQVDGLSVANQEIIEKGILNEEVVKSVLKDIPSKKPGNYGEFQDLKLKLDYSLKNNRTGKIIGDKEQNESLGGIELQVGFSNNNNETRQSNHVFFDRVKQARSFSREASNIGFDQCWNLYQGVFSKMIHKMVKRHKKDYNGYKQGYVNQQFEKQNTIKLDDQTIELHTLGTDDPANAKYKIDITKRLFSMHMKQLLTGGDMIGFFYKNDLGSLGIEKNNGSLSIDNKAHSIEEILQEDPNQRYKYRYVFDPAFGAMQGTIPENTYFQLRGVNKLVPCALVAKVLCNQKRTTHRNNTMEISEHLLKTLNNVNSQ